MKYKDLKFISTSILGEAATTTFDKKVLLIMYYSELLALNFKEVESLFNRHSREKLFKIFYLDEIFVEHIYHLFLNSKLDTIMYETFERLTKIQRLLHQRELLNSCNISGFKQ